MFNWFKKRKNQKYEQLVKEAKDYTDAHYHYVPPPPPREHTEPTKPETKHSRKPLSEREPTSQDTKKPTEFHFPEGKVQYSLKEQYSVRDGYDSERIKATLRSDSSLPTIDLLGMLDTYTNSTFVGKMRSLIREKNLSDTAVYKRAGLDRRLYSKIFSYYDYKPAKDTCMALCLAMRLTLDETNDLLSRAGYTLSHSSIRDVIVEYFIKEGKYSLTDLNETLYRLDQKPLGR